jgi:hypothetical protein
MTSRLINWNPPISALLRLKQQRSPVVVLLILLIVGSLLIAGSQRAAIAHGSCDLTPGDPYKATDKVKATAYYSCTERHFRVHVVVWLQKYTASGWENRGVVGHGISENAYATSETAVANCSTGDWRAKSQGYTRKPDGSYGHGPTPIATRYSYISC